MDLTKLLKVGDQVRITKSSRNWTSNMDKYADKVVTVTKVSRTSIRFNDDGDWNWVYGDGHFEILKCKVYELW